MNENVQKLNTDTAGNVIASGQTVQQIQTQYQTAVSIQVPRDIREVEKNCLTEASLAAEAIFYGWGKGKDKIEGPSIGCAMIAVRNWGNTAVKMLPIVENSNAFIFEAAFIDLETGFTLSRQFRQDRNWKIYGKMDKFRKEDMRFQIGQSKAQRNVILSVIPKWLTDKMIDEAKKGVRVKLESFIEKQGIENAKQLLLKSFNKYGVKQEIIEKAYDKKYEAWDIELLIILKGDIRALQDGIESADSLYGKSEQEKSSEQTSELTNDLKEKAAKLKAEKENQKQEPEQKEEEQTQQETSKQEKKPDDVQLRIQLGQNIQEIKKIIAIHHEKISKEERANVAYWCELKSYDELNGSELLSAVNLTQGSITEFNNIINKSQQKSEDYPTKEKKDTFKSDF